MRRAPPDLVLIALPAAVTPPVDAPTEEAIRAHSWILNWSLSFGLQEWDVVAIAVKDSETDAFEEREGYVVKRVELASRKLPRWTRPLRFT